MENGASILKKLGIIFLCIGTLGVSGSLILCFIVPSLWLFSIIFGSVLAVFLIVGIICMIIYTTKKRKKRKNERVTLSLLSFSLIFLFTQILSILM